MSNLIDQQAFNLDDHNAMTILIIGSCLGDPDSMRMRTNVDHANKYLESKGHTKEGVTKLHQWGILDVKNTDQVELIIEGVLQYRKESGNPDS